MAITVRSTEKAIEKYPRLMETESGRIVLFSEDRKGVVLAGGDSDDCAVGDYINNWIMDQFVDFTDVLHLENS